MKEALKVTGSRDWREKERADKQESKAPTTN
jgi:hypothetical protein